MGPWFLKRLTLTLRNARLASSEVAMIGTSETMSFIPCFLKNFFEGACDAPELGIAFIKHQTILLAIEALGNTDHRNIELQFTQDLLNAIYLTLPPVDNHDVRHWPCVSL